MPQAVTHAFCKAGADRDNGGTMMQRFSRRLWEYFRAELHAGMDYFAALALAFARRLLK